jgi:hypothetical protein
MKKADNKVIEKVRKLLAKANDPSCSQQEMETFLAAANRLQVKHSIESDSIVLDIADFGKDQLEVTRGKKEAKYYESRLLSMIARHNNCKILMNQYRGKLYHYTIIGTQENRAVATEMFQICIEKFRSYAWPRYKEYQKEGKAKWRIELNDPKLGAYDLIEQGYMINSETFVESYLNGTIVGLKEQFDAEKEEELYSEENKKKWGLIVVNHDSLVDEFIAAEYRKIGTTNTSRSLKKADAGFSAGVRDGNSNHGQKQLM